MTYFQTISSYYHTCQEATISAVNTVNTKLRSLDGRTVNKIAYGSVYFSIICLSRLAARGVCQATFNSEARISNVTNLLKEYGCNSDRLRDLLLYPIDIKHSENRCQEIIGFYITGAIVGTAVCLHLSKFLSKKFERQASNSTNSN